MTKLCIGLSGMVWGWAETFGWVWISFVLATVASNSRNSWLLNKLWEVISSSEKNLFGLANQMRVNAIYINLKTRLSLIRFCRCRFPFSLFVFWDFLFHFIFQKTWSDRKLEQIFLKLFWRIENLKFGRFKWFTKQVTSMLVTDVGDQMLWWQIWDVGDQFNTLRKSPK